MRMRSKVIRGESLCGTVADATCETAADAACENCSTITTVKRPTTKCPTAKLDLAQGSGNSVNCGGNEVVLKFDQAVLPPSMVLPSDQV